jgi:hypothetical protein
MIAMPLSGFRRVAAAVFLLSTATLAGCAPPPMKTMRMPNPASQNCANMGGRVLIAKRGDGGEYGVCLFADNKQCEEWALYRGHCPAGGKRLTGYVTAGARYCVLTGGDYRVAAGAAAGRPEQGICALPDGRACDAERLFNGGCLPLR